MGKILVKSLFFNAYVVKKTNEKSTNACVKKAIAEVMKHVSKKKNRKNETVSLESESSDSDVC